MGRAKYKSRYVMGQWSLFGSVLTKQNKFAVDKLSIVRTGL